MGDTCAYLLARYPEDFVHAISIDAHCDVRNHWDCFPILDVVGGRIETAAICWTVHQTFRNLNAAAVADHGVPEKEAGRSRAERDARRDARPYQPWRERGAYR